MTIRDEVNDAYFTIRQCNELKQKASSKRQQVNCTGRKAPDRSTTDDALTQQSNELAELQRSSGDVERTTHDIEPIQQAITRKVAALATAANDDDGVRRQAQMHRPILEYLNKVISLIEPDDFVGLSNLQDLRDLQVLTSRKELLRKQLKAQATQFQADTAELTDRLGALPQGTAIVTTSLIRRLDWLTSPRSQHSILERMDQSMATLNQPNQTGSTFVIYLEPVLKWDIATISPKQLGLCFSGRDVAHLLWLHVCADTDSLPALILLEALLRSDHSALSLGWQDYLVITLRTLVISRASIETGSRQSSSLVMAVFRTVEAILRTRTRISLNELQTHYEAITAHVAPAAQDDALLDALDRWLYATLHETTKCMSIIDVLCSNELLERHSHLQAPGRRYLFANALNITLVDCNTGEISQCETSGVKYGYTGIPDHLATFTLAKPLRPVSIFAIQGHITLVTMFLCRYMPFSFVDMNREIQYLLDDL